MNHIKKSAQSLIEYGLILALVAIIAVAVLTKFGKTITDVGNRTDSSVNNTTTNAGDSYCTGIGMTWDEPTGTCKPAASP